MDVAHDARTFLLDPAALVIAPMSTLFTVASRYEGRRFVPVGIGTHRIRPPDSAARCANGPPASYARAFALTRSNSACVIVPLSSSSCAFAMSSIADPPIMRA